MKRPRPFGLFLPIALMAPPLLVGCPRDPVSPGPPPPYDAGPGTCATWCANAKGLGCEAAKETPGKSCAGKACSCEAVCENIQSSGVIVWNLGCRTAATTCAMADACEH